LMLLLYSDVLCDSISKFCVILMLLLYSGFWVKQILNISTIY
jgi:hypothetical protein